MTRNSNFVTEMYIQISYHFLGFLSVKMPTIPVGNFQNSPDFFILIKQHIESL